MRWLSRYRAVLREPGAWRVVAASACNRTGQFGSGLAILLAVEAQTGSYAAAGAAAGLAMGCAAAGRVWQGRVADRAGPAAVMAPAAVAHLAAVAALAVALTAGAGAAALIVLAMATGATLPAVAAVARTLWSLIAPAPEQRLPAHSIESLVTDLAASAGPAVAALLATTFSPTVGLVVMGLLGSAGGLLLPNLRAERETSPAGRGGARLPVALLLPLVVLVALGITCGVANVAVPAFAEERGRLAAAGLLLALWTVASMVGGIWYGARSWQATVERRLVACTLLLTAAYLAMPLADSLAALTLLLVLAGLPMAALLTTVYVAIDDLMPRERMTEAFAWVASSVPAGSALGTVLGGWVVDLAGVSAAFALGGALMVVAASAAAGHAALRARHSES